MELAPLPGPGVPRPQQKCARHVRLEAPDRHPLRPRHPARAPLAGKIEQQQRHQALRLGPGEAPAAEGLAQLQADIAGALDVSSCRADLTEGFVNLISVAVRDAARRIEAENFRLSFQGSRILLAPGNDTGASGLIAVDPDDIVIGATRAARQSLGVPPERLARQLPAAHLLVGGEDGGEGFDRAERGVLSRALARAGGNASAAARTLGISRATLYRKLRRLERSD